MKDVFQMTTKRLAVRFAIHTTASRDGNARANQPRQHPAAVDLVGKKQDHPQKAVTVPTAREANPHGQMHKAGFSLDPGGYQGNQGCGAMILVCFLQDKDFGARAEHFLTNSNPP